MLILYHIKTGKTRKSDKFFKFDNFTDVWYNIGIKLRKDGYVNLGGYKTFSEAQVGAVISRPVMVVSVSDNVAKNGNSFVKMVIKDGNTSVTATMFDMTSEKLRSSGIVPEAIVDVQLAVGEYQGSKNFKINEIHLTTNMNLSADDFTKLPPVPLEQMYNEIIDILSSSGAALSFNNAPLSDLAIRILEDNKEQYMASSAAVSMHHNIRGGLLYHSYRMVKAAVAISEVYPELDKELLVCGAALHDIGKIWEYKTSVSGDAEVTKAGVLFGHLYMGASLIKDYTKGASYNMEKVMLLTHLILSHHGTQEFGAVACPAVAEAFALNRIDDLDAKIYMCTNLMEDLTPGTFTEKKPFGLDNRIYKPMYKGE